MRILLVSLLILSASAAPAAAQGSADRSRSAWQQQSGRPAPTSNGARPDVQPRRYRAYKLNRGALKRVLDESPRERTRRKPLTVSLPDPDGGFGRFALVQTQMMEPGLAGRHPEIATFAGTGIDDPGSTVRVSLTSLGLQASVRSAAGDWYVDPYYKGQESLYVSYRGEDLENPHGEFEEREPLPPSAPRADFGPPALDGPNVSLRQYRLAFLTDHTYAAYHGAANVTSAKVALINRVNQLYEDDFGIRLVLVAGNDALNLNTAALMTGGGGPCGARACFTSAQAAECSGATLDRNHTVLGQLIGAGNYDVGHIGLGTDGGGLAYGGVVGRWLKGGGCTGVSTPTGDFFAVDYVAHELGHQFDADHTFNGVAGGCGGNITSAAVEPGSGSSVMAYAGICGADNLQSNTDPYFSQMSISQVSGYAARNLGLQAEWQTVALNGFGLGDSFRLTYNGNETTAISWLNYSSATIDAALEALPGLAGAIDVYAIDDAGGEPTTDGFLVRFAIGSNLPSLSVTNASGVTGTVSETGRGGAAQNGGSTVTATTNRAPVATVPATAYTIPARTPFWLTAGATDADGDPLTYSWEQNDAAAGKALLSNTKLNGPLFRQFHRASTAAPNPLVFAPAGQNHAAATPTRVFPDIAQVAANNTNAATGTCPTGNVECFSEFLPTSAYAQPMHFRLTVRDGNPLGGGVASADTTVNVATGAGPFLVNPLPASSYSGGSQVPISWQVNGTSGAPVNAANVRISLSTDGGLTYPHELAASTPNDGGHQITLPSVSTSAARVRVEAVGNVFFDITDANFTITPAALTASNTVGTVTVDYSDPITPSKTVSGRDDDSDGASLTASAPALPAGLGLQVASTSANSVRPGTRTWNLAGNVTAAPGTYPVTATVGDGVNSAPTAFTVNVTAEDADVAYTGPASVVGTQGQTLATVTLQATVSDPDGGSGDLSTAQVTFEKDGVELCSGTADASGAAACDAQLPAGAHDLDVVVGGGRYAGTGTGAVEVSFPAFTATDSGDASVQFSDTPATTISAIDEDSPGAALNESTTGLPAGLTLQVISTGANTRTWQLAGAVAGAPGVYPVTVTVDDGGGHSAQTSFTLTVTREDVLVTDDTDDAVQGVEGAMTSPVTMRADLVETGDGAPGDLTKASVTFKDGAETLCTDTTATPGGAAECVAQLPPGVTDFTIEAGDHYSGSGAGSVEVQAPLFTATSNDAGVQYSDLPAVTIAASDDNTPGEDLVADGSQLPAGLSLVVDSTGAGLPGTRTWKLAGKALAAPGVHPVEIAVSDGQHIATTSFTLTITPEDVTVTYTGATSFTGAPGATTALVPLRATVHDGDGSAGDLTRASVTFSSGGRTLCGPVSADASGAAGCDASLPAGTTPVRASAAGHYTGGIDSSVAVTFPAAPAAPAAPAGSPAPAAPVPSPVPAPTATPTVSPRPVTPALSLTGIGRSVKVKKGRFRLKLTCRPAGQMCTGTLKVKRGRTTVATVRYSVTGTTNVTARLNAKGRRALKRSLSVKATAGKASRSFKLRK